MFTLLSLLKIGPIDLFWQIRMESILCARHCARHQEYKWRVSLGPAKELSNYGDATKEAVSVNYIMNRDKAEMKWTILKVENANIGLHIKAGRTTEWD